MFIFCKYFILSLIVFGLICCKQPTDPAPPADTVDIYTGTTWSRYGFKSPVNGKEVYYYLTFKKNFQIDSYIKYNKTESTPDEAETITYNYGGRLFLITFKSGTYPADFQAAGLTIHYPTGDISYTKE